MGVKIIHLERFEDASGISGTGIVAEAVEFSNGKVALCFKGDLASVNIYDNLKAVEAVHGHDGKTRVVIYNPKIESGALKPEAVLSAGELQDPEENDKKRESIKDSDQPKQKTKKKKVQPE